MRRESLNEIVNERDQPDAGRDGHHGRHDAPVGAVALFLFGGEVLRGFAFTMIVGIITGTYSSVFIAAAIVTFWRRQASRAASAHVRRVRRRRARAARNRSEPKAS